MGNVQHTNDVVNQPLPQTFRESKDMITFRWIPVVSKAVIHFHSDTRYPVSLLLHFLREEIQETQSRIIKCCSPAHEIEAQNWLAGW